MSAWNDQHPTDPVSIVHEDTGDASPGNLSEIEANLARGDLTWHARTGQRIVHWGGTAHLIVGTPRTVPPNETHRNAGGMMRAQLGRGYRVVALTAGSGFAPFPVPTPPHDFTEDIFADITGDAVLLDLARVPADSPEVIDWLHRPLRTRMIGPVYDPAKDHDSRVDAGRLTESVDVLLHAPRISATRPLAAG